MSEPRTRTLPTTLLGYVFLLAFTCVDHLRALPDLPGSWFTVGSGVVAGVTAVALWLGARWGHYLALGFMGLRVVRHLGFVIAGTGSPGGHLALAAVWAYGVWFASRPETRRIFEGPARVDHTAALTYVVQWTLGAIPGTLVWMATHSFIAAMVVFLGVGLAVTFFAERFIHDGLARLLHSAPDDLPREHWQTYQEARTHCVAKRPQDALHLLAGLPDVPPVLALRGAARALDEEASPLIRTLYRAEPQAVQAALVLRADIAAVLARREQELDALVADRHRSRPLLLSLQEDLQEALLGEIRLLDHDVLPDWWQDLRPRSTGEAAVGWLVVRLWRSGSLPAALEAAKGTELELLCRRVLRWRTQDLTALREDADEDSTPWYAHVEAAEALGLYLRTDKEPKMDPIRAGIAERARLADQALALWRLHGETAPGLFRSLLLLLTGLDDDDGELPGWVARAERYDRHLRAGLEDMQHERWKAASEQFHQARQDGPDRFSALHNEAMAHLALGDGAAAMAILQDAHERDQDRLLWWYRMGDAHVLQDDVEGALAAWAEVSRRLDGFTLPLVYRMGHALHRTGRHEEAERLLERLPPTLRDRSLGRTLPNPSESDPLWLTSMSWTPPQPFEA